MSKKIAIKIGGAASAQLTSGFFQKIKDWQNQGHKIVIIHGGGDYISELMTKLQEPINKIDGIRYTSKEGVMITKLALLGQVQPELIANFSKNKLATIGLNAANENLLLGNLLDEKKYGYVGEINTVNTTYIEKMWQLQLLPIIAPMAKTSDGQWLNVNADQAATTIAKCLKVDELYLLTDVSGIKLSGSVLSNLTPKEAIKLQQKNVITGGMIPKMTNAITAAQSGIAKVCITNTIEKTGTTISI